MLALLLRAYLARKKLRSSLILNKLIECSAVLAYVLVLATDYHSCITENFSSENGLKFVQISVPIYIATYSVLSVWILSTLTLVLLYIFISLASYNTFFVSKATISIQAILVGSFWIYQSYINDHNSKNTLNYNEKTICLYREIYSALPEGILVVNKAKKITFINDAFLSLLGFEIPQTNLTFNKIFKDRDIEFIKTVKQNQILTINPASPTQEKSFSRLANPKNLNDLHHQVWRNWEELWAHFESLNESHLNSSHSYFHYCAELLQPNRQKKPLLIKFGMKRISQEPQCIFIITEKPSDEEKVAINPKHDTLITSMAHEIMAQANRTISCLSLLTDNIQNNQRLLLLATVQVTAIIQTVSSVLDYYRNKHGSLRMSHLHENLSHTIKQVIQDTENYTPSTIRVELSLPESLQDHWITTDHRRLSQVLYSLVTSLAKILSYGPIKISVVPENKSLKLIISSPKATQINEEVRRFLNLFDFEKRASLPPANEMECYDVVILSSHEIVTHLGNNTGLGLPIHLEYVPMAGYSFSFHIEDQHTQTKEYEEPLSSIPTDRREEMKYLLDPTMSRTYGTRDRTGSTTNPFFGTFLKESEISRCHCPQILLIEDNSLDSFNTEAIFASLDMPVQFAASEKEGLNAIMRRLEHPCGKECSFFVAIFVSSSPLLVSLDSVGTKIHDLLASKKNCPVIGCKVGNMFREAEQNNLGSSIQVVCDKPLTREKVLEAMKKAII